MKLLTIADLNQPQEVLEPLMKKAFEVSELYSKYLEEAHSSYSYKVHIGGDSERASGIHASEMSRCMRLLVYSIRGEQRIHNPNAAWMRKRFKIGHAVHAMIQNDFKRMAANSNGTMHFEEEVEIHPDLGGPSAVWNLRSHCDGRFTFFENDEPILRIGLEIKTKSGPEFAKLQKPESDHIEQTTLYMAALDVPLMWVLYYNKSNSNITPSTPPWLYRFNHQLWEALEIRFAKAQHMAQSNQDPDRVEGIHCSWCPFFQKCQPENLKKAKSAKPTAPRATNTMRTTRWGKR